MRNFKLIWDRRLVCIIFSVYTEFADNRSPLIQQLKKGVVTLTVRTRLRSPSLTPCPTPTLLSRSSSPNSNTSGGTPIPPGFDDGDSRKGPGPKDRIIMEVTLNKGSFCIVVLNQGQIGQNKARFF